MVRSRGSSSSRSRKGSTTVDLSDVESRVVIPEGEYTFRVKAIEDGKGDAGKYLKWTFAVVGGKYDGVAANSYITTLAPQGLFNLKGLLEALSVEIPDSAFDIDHDDMIDREMMGTIEHDVYEGRKQSKIVDFWPAEEEEAPPKRGRASKKEKDEEEESPKRGRGKGGKKKEITEDEVADMSQDELDELIDEHQLDVDLGKSKTLSKMRAAVIDAMKDAGLIEGEEEPEPEEEAPRSRRGRSKREEPEEPDPEEDDRPTRRRRR